MTDRVFSPLYISGILNHNFVHLIRMKKLTLVIFILISGLSLNAQKFATENGHIKFHSKTEIEAIEAHNHQVNCTLDTKAGEFEFIVPMRSFIFDKALMKEHFNEKYLESDKYPNTIFNGKIENLEEIDFDIAGEYDIVVKGKLSLHGITNDISETGILIVKGDQIVARSTFNILLDDYNIKIPLNVRNNISETIDIIVDATMEEDNK